MKFKNKNFITITLLQINMENNHYNQLLQYLQHKTLPETIETKQQQQIIKQSKIYKLQQNLLYKIDKRNQTIY